jgi:hypothetical protein
MANPGSATLRKLHHRSQLQLCPLQIGTSLFRKKQFLFELKEMAGRS